MWQGDTSCLEDVAHLARDVGSGSDDATILSMVTSWRRSRSRRSGCHWGVRPLARQTDMGTSARNEQNTSPRMAAPDWWKIGRVLKVALAARSRLSTSSKSRYRSTSWSGVTFAFIRTAAPPGIARHRPTHWSKLLPLPAGSRDFLFAAHVDGRIFADSIILTSKIR